MKKLWSFLLRGGFPYTPTLFILAKRVDDYRFLIDLLKKEAENVQQN